MFGCKNRKKSTAVEAAPSAPAPAPSASHMHSLGKAGMLGLSTVATVGPRHLRPHAQNLLALIGIITLARQIIGRKRGKAA